MVHRIHVIWIQIYSIFGYLSIKSKSFLKNYFLINFDYLIIIESIENHNKDYCYLNRIKFNLCYYDFQIKFNYIDCFFNKKNYPCKNLKLYNVFASWLHLSMYKKDSLFQIHFYEIFYINYISSHLCKNSLPSGIWSNP